MIGAMANIVVSTCVEHVLKQAVVQIIPQTATTASKWMARIGVMAMAGVIGKAIGDSVDNDINEMKQSIAETKKLMIEEEKRKMIDIPQEEEAQ